MQKIMVCLIAALMVISISSPVFATDFSAKGEFRLRGYSNSHPNLSDSPTDDSDAWMDYRFRIQPEFTVSENLKLVTRFDGLDGELSGDTSNPDVLDFDRAWMVIKTDIGKFDVGRMQGGTFGTDFADSERDADRIKYTLTSIDNLILLGLIEKRAENDLTNELADSDSDAYYIAGIYKTEAITCGLLAGWFVDKSNESYDGSYQMWDPYFTTKINDVRLQGELFLFTGTRKDYPEGSGTNDVDMAAMAWNFEAGYTMGPLEFELGYAWLQGDDNPSDDSIDNMPAGPGTEWGKVWILTGTDTRLDAGTTPLGGFEATGAPMGNMATPGSTTVAAGGKLLYASAAFSPHGRSHHFGPVCLGRGRVRS